MARWTSGIIIALLAIALLQWGPNYLIDGVVVVVCGLSLMEYFQMTLRHTSFLYRALGILLGMACCSWLVVSGPERAGLILSAMLLLTFFIHLWGSEEAGTRLKKISLFFLGASFFGFMAPYLSWVVHLPDGKFWVYLMLVCNFMSDTGAYIFGKWIGRYHLAPFISPGKTYEGLMGGWLFSIGAALIVRQLFLPDFSVGNLLIIASLIPFVGLIGDLSESLVKRGMGVKDSGTLIPGHGGVWDRVDALFFVAPLVYYFAMTIT